jgi:hypothetical protein
MGGLFLAKQVDIEQVVPEVDMQGNRIGQQEAVAGAEIDGKTVVAGKAGRTEPGADVKRRVVGAPFADEALARQNVVTNVEVVIGELTFAVG